MAEIRVPGLDANLGARWKLDNPTFASKRKNWHERGPPNVHIIRNIPTLNFAKDAKFRMGHPRRQKKQVPPLRRSSLCDDLLRSG